MAHKYLACSGFAGAPDPRPEQLLKSTGVRLVTIYAVLMAMNTTRFLEEARRLTDQRMAAAETIADALARRDEAHAAAAAADAEAESAFRDAERAGWTAAELNRLRPADLGTRKRAGRPRKARRPASTSETSPTDVSDNAAVND